MKKVLVVLLVLTLSVSAAHAFNVWDFISDPPPYPSLVGVIGVYEISPAIARREGPKLLPWIAYHSVDREMTLVLAKIALFSHYPNTNGPTNALLTSVLPRGDGAHREVRWLGAFLGEVQATYGGLAAQVDGWYAADTRTVYYVSVDDPVRTGVRNWLDACHIRARQIVDQMQVMEVKRMTALASDTVFVRDSARVKLGEIHGFMLTSGSQNITVKVRPGGNAMFYAPLTTLDMNYAEVAVGTAGTATAHVTAKSQPLLVSLGNATPSVMLKNANQSFTAPQVAQGLKVWVMAVPTVTQHVGNQSVGVGVEQTVNFAFGGELLRYSIASSQPSVATVRITETGIAAITGVRAGNSTITISATNTAGTAVTSFLVTVPASD